MLLATQASLRDMDRLLPILERHVEIKGVAPHQVAVDGGYANGANREAQRTLPKKHLVS